MSSSYVELLQGLVENSLIDVCRRQIWLMVACGRVVEVCGCDLLPGPMLIHSARLNHYWAMNKSFVQSFQKFKELLFSKVCIVFVRQNEFSYWKMLSLSQIAILRGIPASWWNVLSSSTCQCKTVSLVLSECLPILMISFHYLEFIYSFQAFTFFIPKKNVPGEK